MTLTVARNYDELAFRLKSSYLPRKSTYRSQIGCTQVVCSNQLILYFEVLETCSKSVYQNLFVVAERFLLPGFGIVEFDWTSIEFSE